MIPSSKRITLWANHVPINKYPAYIIPNYSLGKTVSSFNLYVPLHTATSQQNVLYVSKKNSDRGTATEDLSIKSDMRGSGATLEMALLHPIKVKCLCYLKHIVIGFCRSLELN